MIFSKQKQLALIKLGVVTAAVLFALWFFLIHSAQNRHGQKIKAGNDLAQKIADKKRVIQHAEQINSQMNASSKELRDIEAQMVTGDIYLWIEKILRDFEIPQQVEFLKYDPPQIIESSASPKLPYKTALFSVSGTATYHDFGIFLANFENSYPHIRIRRLDLEPASFGPSKSEKLTFLMEMQVFVNPGNAAGRRSR